MEGGWVGGRERGGREGFSLGEERAEPNHGETKETAKVWEEREGVRE